MTSSGWGADYMQGLVLGRKVNVGRMVAGQTSSVLRVCARCTGDPQSCMWARAGPAVPSFLATTARKVRGST